MNLDELQTGSLTVFTPKMTDPEENVIVAMRPSTLFRTSDEAREAASGIADALTLFFGETEFTGEILEVHVEDGSIQDDHLTATMNLPVMVLSGPEAAAQSASVDHIAALQALLAAATEQPAEADQTSDE